MSRPASPTPWAFSAALCLLAPFFFLSNIFLPVTALPLLYLRSGSNNERQGRIWLFIAVPLGALICGFFKGPAAGFGFVLAGGIPAAVLGEMLSRKFTVERSVLTSMAVILGIIGLLLNVWSVQEEKPVLQLVQEEATRTIVTVAKTTLSVQGEQLSDASREMIEQARDNPNEVLRIVPGTVLTLILLLCSIPVIGLIRWNPKRFRERVGVKRDFIRRWRNPEWFVWPTLICLAILIFELKNFDVLALSIILPLSFLYFYQGMAIASYFLDLFRARGPLRAVFYAIALFWPPLTFMIASFGFFDLWFNFRERIRPGKPKA